jgi:hypothetical protein
MGQYLKKPTSNRVKSWKKLLVDFSTVGEIATGLLYCGTKCWWAVFHLILKSYKIIAYPKTVLSVSETFGSTIAMRLLKELCLILVSI